MNGITQTTALWYASRATGVVSLLMLSLVVILGMLVNRQGRLPGMPSFAVTGLHRNLSLLSVAFVAVHVATAIADPYVTIQLISAVIPFTSGYEPFWLGLGAISLDLIIALIVTSLLRARMSHRVWRGVHWLAYAAWPVAFAHSIGSSPDMRGGWLRALAIACALAVGGALLWRVTRALRDVPRSARAAAILAASRRPLGVSRDSRQCTCTATRACTSGCGRRSPTGQPAGSTGRGWNCWRRRPVFWRARNRRWPAGRRAGPRCPNTSLRAPCSEAWQASQPWYRTWRRWPTWP